MPINKTASEITVDIIRYAETTHGVSNVKLQFDTPDEFNKYDGIPSSVVHYLEAEEKRGCDLRLSNNCMFVIGDFDPEKYRMSNENLDEIKKNLSDDEKVGVPSIILLDACPNDPNLDDGLLDCLAPLLSRDLNEEYRKEFREKHRKAYIDFLLIHYKVSLNGCDDSDCEICSDTT